MDKQTEVGPFFSVVIPTYNRAHAIAEAIASVKVQTFAHWELVIVDDGSTDNTRQVVEKEAIIDPRIRYIYQQNAERSAARNNGVLHSLGQYICFLDSDDIYLPTHLEAIKTQIDALQQPVAMFYTGSCGIKQGEIVPYPDYVTKTTDPYERVLKDSICPQRVCLHRQVALKHTFDIALRINEDRELWARVVAEFPIIAVPSKTAVIRDLGDRTVTSNVVAVHLKNLEVLQQIIRNSGSKIKVEWSNFALSAAYHKIALAYRSTGQNGKFYRYMLKSIWAMPSHFIYDKILTIIGLDQ